MTKFAAAKHVARVVSPLALVWFRPLLAVRVPHFLSNGRGLNRVKFEFRLKLLTLNLLLTERFLTFPRPLLKSGTTRNDRLFPRVLLILKLTLRLSRFRVPIGHVKKNVQKVMVSPLKWRFPVLTVVFQLLLVMTKLLKPGLPKIAASPQNHFMMSGRQMQFPTLTAVPRLVLTLTVLPSRG